MQSHIKEITLMLGKRNPQEPLFYYFNMAQLVEKLRCILSLPNLFPSLARRFACCQSCSVSRRTLWAYGFDSAAPRALEKSQVGEKEKYFIPFNQLYFLKSRLRSAIKTGESHPERAWS